jgi:hypothetical protein
MGIPALSDHLHCCRLGLGWCASRVRALHDLMHSDQPLQPVQPHCLGEVWVLRVDGACIDRCYLRMLAFMMQAAIYGVVTSLALVLGAVLGVWLRFPQRLIAIVLAFAAGSLITALAFELFLIRKWR